LNFFNLIFLFSFICFQRQRQTTFRFAGALKLEEIVRALTALFGRHSSVPVRGRFSRLREVMLVLTSDSTATSNMIADSFTQLTANEVDAFISLRLDTIGGSTAAATAATGGGAAAAGGGKGSYASAVAGANSMRRQ
jgi:hypothetical protein